MADLSPILSLPYILPAQAQKHVTHNEALRLLDLLVQLVVSDRNRVEPPAVPLAAGRHVVADGAIGAWAGHDGDIAVFEGGAWQFLVPQPGWRAHVLDEAVEIVRTGGGWALLAQPVESVPMLGINAAADTTNRLSVAAPATLLNHEGAGHQLKVNKAAAADTASLLFQTGYSGRAEMGLTGSDAFAIKVSDDGATFRDALRVDPATGRPRAPQGLEVDGAVLGTAVQQSPGDVTPGRLMRADYGYGRGNLVGTVSQSGGQPSGAVIERGGNANGTYVRFADGTQICWGWVTTQGAAETVWTFPAMFANAVNMISPSALPFSTNPIAISPRMSAISLTSLSVSAFTSANARVAVQLRMTAFGVWA